MIIDAHMHVGAWDHPDFLGRASTVGDAVEVMADAGLSGGVMLPTDQCDNAGLLAAMRSAVGAGRLLWFVPWVRPAGSEAGDADLAWAEAHRDAVAGLKIHPSLSRVRVTDAAFAPALALAAEREWVVLVHCGRWQEMASYRFAVEAAERHPRAKFLLAHAGGDTPPLATAAAELVAERKLANVWFEMSGLREYWVLERNVARLGADRYLLGSDYALAHPLMYIGAVRGMRLPDEAKQKILGQNALDLFGAPLGR
jgi:predicted TIM-barrel fold metal-dependent hydrolase